ncbi:MAG: squalene/phytoene synthase family protein, partial [Alphaproteobacteria bacterium]
MAGDRNARIETPSGKGAKDENFPVASRLLSSRYRPQIAAFYDFARAADDIADNPDLDPDEKIRRLDAFEYGLDASSNIPKAATLARCLAESRVTDRHARDLLTAFRQDARKSRYATMSELHGYCALSASPVGRFLLDLHGEDAALYRHSDPLCDALQILNHLQDISDDFASLDRVYLPADLMAARGVTEAGADAWTIGLAGTEEMYCATAELGACLGIEVTASHNPIDYNGMKLVAAGARPLDPGTDFQTLRRRAEAAAWREVDRTGEAFDKSTEARRRYVEKVLSFIDVKNLAPLKILINSGNGAAGPTFDAIADALAARGAPLTFTRHHPEPDPSFPNGCPNPLLPENHAATAEAV